MLGKLIKNEYRATARLILPLYIVLIVVTLLNKLVLIIDNDPASLIAQSKVFAALGVLLMLTYVLSLIAVCALTVIFIIKRFYDNMLKDEGYLSFTLPVTVKQHLASKIIVSYSWILATIAAVFASINILFAGLGIGELWEEIGNGIKYALENGYQGIFITFIGMVILAIYNVVITPYVCLSVGQLFNGHKVVGAFVTYIIIYIINQIIGVVAIVAMISTGAGNIDTMSDVEIMKFSMNFEFVLLLVETVAFTVITHFMLSKKLNLD